MHTDVTIDATRWADRQTPTATASGPLPPRRAHARTLRKVALGVAGIVGFLVTWQLHPDARASSTRGTSRPRPRRSRSSARTCATSSSGATSAARMTAWAIGLLIATVAGHRARHDHRARAVPAPRDPHDRRVPAADPVGRAHPARRADVRLSSSRRRSLIIVFASFWQVFIQVLYGVADVDAVARDTARSFGLLARVAHRQPRLPHGAAVPHDRAAPGRGGRADPRDHGRDVHRQPRARARDRLRPVRRQLAGGVRAGHRHRAARSAHQPRLPLRSSAGRCRGTSRCEGRRCCDPLHEHRRHAAPPARGSWAKIGENILYAIGLPILLAGDLGHLGDGRPRAVLPQPARAPRGVRRHLDRPGVRRPTCCRASVASPSASSLSIVVGIAAGTLIGLEPLAARPARADARVLPRDAAAGAASRSSVRPARHRPTP